MGNVLCSLISFFLLLGSIGWFTDVQLYESVKQDRSNTEKTVATLIQSETGRIVAVIRSVGVDPSQIPDASSWDTDVYRQSSRFHFRAPGKFRFKSSINR